MSRKRSLSEKERDNLQKCLKIPGISEEHVRQVWNIAGELREGACEASTKTVRWKLYEFTDLDELQHVYKPSITCL